MERSVCCTAFVESAILGIRLMSVFESSRVITAVWSSLVGQAGCLVMSLSFALRFEKCKKSVEVMFEPTPIGISGSAINGTESWEMWDL
jgi:hypothetical protein